MIIRVGLENGIEGRSLAWALDFPGCFAYGKDANTALVSLPAALLQYERWVHQHTPAPWVSLGNFDIRLVDAWEDYKINAAFEEADEGIEVKAWFLDDWRPLSAEEIERGLLMLDWSRADLRSIVSGLDDASLDAPRGDPDWTVRKVLAHIASTEAWYLDRLDWRQAGKPDPSGCLDEVRSELSRQLAALGDRRLVSGKDGEFWSPRKLLRRALWHERDHTRHILKLLGLLVEETAG